VTALHVSAYSGRHEVRSISWEPLCFCADVFGVFGFIVFLYHVNVCKIEVFTAVTRKNYVFWDLAPCRYCVNRRFGGPSVYTISTGRHIPEDGILPSLSMSHVIFGGLPVACLVCSVDGIHSER
jgi:hypothetical protein